MWDCRVVYLSVITSSGGQGLEFHSQREHWAMCPREWTGLVVSLVYLGSLVSWLDLPGKVFRRLSGGRRRWTAETCRESRRRRNEWTYLPPHYRGYLQWCGRVINQRGYCEVRVTRWTTRPYWPTWWWPDLNQLPLGDGCPWGSTIWRDLYARVIEFNWRICQSDSANPVGWCLRGTSVGDHIKN